MVFVRDEGSRFDAPIDVVWKYLMGAESHDAAHRSTRNGKFEPISDTSFRYSSERHVGDAWLPEAMRITALPPVGITTEFLEGRFAGSKMLYVYSPHGDRTGIDVFGDFHSPTLSDGDLEAAVRGFLDSEFAEDAPAVRAFARR